MSRHVTKGMSVLRAATGKKRTRLPFPFSDPNVSYWYSGQTALWQGLRQLGLASGDGVLVPAYTCGSEIDVLVKAGLSLDFYRLTTDLTPDLDHLHQLCRGGPKAIYVTHYFGFPQPVDDLLLLAREKNMLLIEDNAHGLYSRDEGGRWLGGAGDMSIFSLHKTLPVPDGGALFVGAKPAGVQQENGAMKPGRLPVLGSVAFVVAQEFMYRLPAVLYHPVFRLKARADREISERPDDYDFDVRRGNWRISSLSDAILRRVDHDHVWQRRRANFETLDRNFIDTDRTQRLLGRLAPGCSPWFYPVRAAHPDGRVEYLSRNGVWSGRFWRAKHPAVPLQDFPFEHRLKDEVVVLPVHQDVEEEQMMRIAGLLNRWSEGAAVLETGKSC